MSICVSIFLTSNSIFGQQLPGTFPANSEKTDTALKAGSQDFWPTSRHHSIQMLSEGLRAGSILNLLNQGCWSLLCRAHPNCVGTNQNGKESEKTAFVKVLWVCSKLSCQCNWPLGKEEQFWGHFPKGTKICSICAERQLQYKQQERMPSGVATIKASNQRLLYTLADRKRAMN